MDHEERLLDADYRAHGRAGGYRAPGAAPGDPDTPCRLKLERPGAREGRDAGPMKAVSFGRGVIQTNAQPLAILVRQSEISEPVIGGLFTLDGRSYRIGDHPQAEDPEGLEWRCAVEAT